MAASRLIAVALLLLAAACGPGRAQGTRDLGLPPPSGSQNPVLPPPSGSQNPVLPPESGQRYLPGVGGRWGDPAPGRAPLPARPAPRSSSDLSGSVSLDLPATAPDPLQRIGDVPLALRRCWNPPSLAKEGKDVSATVRFSLRRNGTLFGQPRVAWEKPLSDPALGERFSASIVAAVRECTPMRLSPGLGAAIAGRPFTIRFHGRGPSNESTS